MPEIDLNYQANTYCGMVAKSRLMHERVFKKIHQAAATDVTVLMLGETGVGKELTARAIHSNSQRKGHKYIPVNCAAIPDGLIESELYGHVRGSFTGAMNSRDGKFTEADKGTIYFDEIASMPNNQQPKLLRVLEDMLITPVGTNRTLKVDVRVIAGTNQDLYKAIREGAFRTDLYYRLAAVTIQIPPLRERLGDIPMLIKYFMEKYKQQYGRIVPDFTPREYIEFMRYNWPGNVRELENAVKGIIASGEDKLEKLTDLKQTDALILSGIVPAQSRTSIENYSLRSWRDLQRDVLVNLLIRNNGNKAATARELGIDVKTVRNHTKKIREELELEQPSGKVN